MRAGEKPALPAMHGIRRGRAVSATWKLDSGSQPAVSPQRENPPASWTRRAVKSRPPLHVFFERGAHFVH